MPYGDASEFVLKSTYIILVRRKCSATRGALSYSMEFIDLKVRRNAIPSNFLRK